MVSVVVTFLAVAVALVFFRADNLESGLSIIRSWLGLTVLRLPENSYLSSECY